MHPLARIDDLIIEDLATETVIYDPGSHRAHCLNKTASFVRKQCDGRTSEEEIARRISTELGVPPDLDIVRLALHQLSRARLLMGESATPNVTALPSRRELGRRMALIGGSALALLPVVTSILAPTPSMAASGGGGNGGGGNGGGGNGGGGNGGGNQQH